MVGIFGGDDSPRRPIQLFTLDSSLLQSAFNAQIAQKTAGQLPKITQSNENRFGPDVVPPWDKPLSALDLPDELGEHLSRTNLFADTDNGLRSDLDKTSEGLFRIWKGLKKIHELTIFASEDKRADLVRSQLQAQFERYESELGDFVAAQQLSGVKVIAGPLETEVETATRIPRSSSEYEGKQIFSSTTDEVAGLDTNTRFNINVVKSDDTVIDVAIDLADMGATPKSLGAISEHLNTELEAAGVTTRFFTYGDADGKFGLKVTRSILEEVTLTPVDAEQVAYVAGTSGNDDFAKGSLRKFVDIAATPTQEFDIKTEAEDGASEIQAVAKGSNGELFTLGTTTGDVGGQLVGGQQDVFLTRYDAAGNEVWRRMVGATDTADGYGLAVAADGSIAISGRANKPLTSGSPDNGTNSFVTLYDSGGEAQWTRNTGPTAVDAAFAVGFDASGDVIVAGATSGPLSGETHQGGQDAYVQRLSAASGSVVSQSQFGDTGNETASALTIDNGTVYVAGTDDGQGFVKTFDADDLAAGATATISVGGVAETTRLSSIKVDGAGKIFVGGETSDAGLVGAGTSGRLTHSGGADGFVARIDEATAAIDFGAYIGSAGTDRVRDIAISSSGEIFVTGETEGDLDGNNLVGTRDGFMTRMDANGAPLSTTTFTGINGRADANGIVIDDAGDSPLTRLGIGHGNIGDIGSRTVAAASSVRPGMSFSVSVDDGAVRRIEIEADDSVRWVAFELNKVLGKDGLAEVKKDGDFEFIKISGKNDSKITLGPGNDGFNALPGLGLREGDIFGKDVEDDDSVFALGFGGFVNLNDFEASEKARDHLNFTLTEIEKAFDFLSEREKDPLEKRRQEALLQRPPQFLQNQISNFQAALTRLTV
jgi:hypothetical protein